MSGIGSNNGWMEAAIAWEVCASLHRQYCKGKDALFTTRQSDFVKHAENAREHISHGQAPAQAAPAYKDSTPELHVGDSAFESWYSAYNPSHKSDKQRARDAYAAGMVNHKAQAIPGVQWQCGPQASGFTAPQADSQPEPVLGTIAHVGTGKTTLTGAIASALRAARAPADSVTAPAAGAVAWPTLDVQAKIDSNTWDHFGDILPTLKAISRGDWYWGANSRCKYIEIRIDTRDGGCILYDRDRVRISPEQFAFQAGGGCGKMEPWPATNAIPPSSAQREMSQ